MIWVAFDSTWLADFRVAQFAAEGGGKLKQQASELLRRV